MKTKNLIGRKRKNSSEISHRIIDKRIKKESWPSRGKLRIKKKFFAKLRKDMEARMINQESNEVKSALKGNDIIFERRKQEAKNIFEEIKDININNNKNHEIIRNKINTALSYDNINKENIYKSLKYFYEMNDKINFKNTLNKFKYCLTKKFSLVQNNNETNNNNNDLIKIINLNEEMEIPKDLVLFEDDDNLINEIKKALESLEFICEGIKNIQIGKKLTVKQILRTKLIKNGDIFKIEEKNTTDYKLQNINNNIYNFLFYYLYINEFQYFEINQPLDYDYNSSVYLINVFYRIYYNAINLSHYGESKFVRIDENIMKKIYSMRKYKNYIFELLENNNNEITKEIDDAFETYFYYLESNHYPDDLENIMEESIKSNIPLNTEKIKKFIDTNKDAKKKYEYDDEILTLDYEGKKYSYKYKCYNDNLLDFLRNNNNPKIIEQAKWNECLMVSYFDEGDVSYLKSLIKKILKSKLFKDVYSEYSDVNNYIDYYFNEEENIDDMLSRIRFINFGESDTGRQAGTIPKNLKIITSSLYVSKIKNKNDFINFKLLEVGRKLIIILHEIVHFIKRALNLITNGIILGSTIESEKGNADIIEAGRYFEQLVFNLENKFIKKRSKSSKKREENDDKKEYFNFLNIKKVLKILDPNSYNKNIDEFKTYLESNEENNVKTMDSELEKYINEIQFNLKDYYINKKPYENYKINCSRNAITSYYIEYTSDNHNYLYKRKQLK